ncbi:alginate export family protein [Cellulophaga sp. F20128]|uniref:alginate export family protein n=1 Tax=Cellulophaga sp. F20128 TaxID=2926413 RepID=UPI001FF2D140|nr:alginate export family protein [Cellulophaga sp. F20128]MCK0156116.1 alginate export family protein [Cellulophaga sp. F20128]
MNFHKNYIFIGMVFILSLSNAQEFNLDAELRPRFEYRNGFNTLTAETFDPATFVSQRTRLNFGYKNADLHTYISLQNVRTWGDISTLSPSDSNGSALHQAWAEAILGQWRFKLGRQEIVYDNHRIFGNVGWAQQARSHDALLIKYLATPKSRLDIGFALNENSESVFEQEYTVNNYKNFQYLWYSTHLKQINISLLFLNTGFAYTDPNQQKVAYNQTFGITGDIHKNKWNADASLYAQTGKIENTQVAALNASAQVSYSLNPKFLVGLGAEYLSGTAMNETDGKLHSFTPLFGTNHKFNGLMDYFYVGNHSNSVGLVDIHANLNYTKNKFSAILAPHFFSSAATVVATNNLEQDSYLGTEIDLTLGYKVSNNITFNAGYSQMFASDTMEIIKGGDASKTNNWAWAMITFSPQFLSYTKD